MVQIVGQNRAFHHTDVDAAALNGGFTGFDAFRILGNQRHFRALMAEVIKKNPSAD